MKRIARYFGFIDDDLHADGMAVTPLVLLWDDVLRRSLLLLALLTAATAFAVGPAGWDVATVAISAAVGVVVFGAAQYAFDVRKWVPSGPLRPVPDDATWHPRPGRQLLRRSIVVVPVLAALVLAFD